jgi:hypothetical protein
LCNFAGGWIDESEELRVKKKGRKEKSIELFGVHFASFLAAFFSPLLREWHISIRHFMENFFAFDRRETAERLCSNPFALASRSYKRKVLVKGGEEVRPNNDSIAEVSIDGGKDGDKSGRSPMLR